MNGIKEMLKTGSEIIDAALESIRPLDKGAMERAEQRLDTLTKPKDSLGYLEEFAKKIAGITGEKSPTIGTKTVFVFAGDHGITAEGVSAFPAEVTTQMVLNFLAGGAGINVIARHVGAEVKVVDIGVNADFDDAPGLLKKKVVRGTGNIAKGPAMTREQALKCIEIGVEIAREFSAPNAIFGTGEMGIGNTTPSAALVSVFTGLKPAEVTGRGTGIDDKSYARKVEAIEEALRVNTPDPTDPIDVLAKVGGAEIAGIAGLIIGAASEQVPVVVDGFISTAGALVASRLHPEVEQYLFASHSSVERGHRAALDAIGIRPFLDLNLRLGEGTGGALAMSTIEAALKVFNEMATFSDAEVSEKE
jgi:nicotinate-nucleotide--dimethylbenzimidazole phosphoribosyltransferase